jgi:ligand-binding sensor protein
MLVILGEEQIFPVKQICQGCLLADRSGSPRWRQGKLCCGHLLGGLESVRATRSQTDRPAIYECEMGFKIAEIK